MKSKLYTIILLFLFIGLCKGYSNNQIEISLLTCSGGDESFTSWGHSAIRIIDKTQSSDIVYNFGLFYFDTPNFYLKFVQGRLKYKLGVHRTQRFIRSYRDENRTVIEQKLNLPDSVEIKLINELQYLYRPENRYYYYSFLKKNCTTELRDLILRNIETDFQNNITDKTSRDLINEYMQSKPWLKLGINLIFGPAVDKKVDIYESMFLPDYLLNAFNDIKINNQNLVNGVNLLNDTNNPANGNSSILNPIILFSLLFLLTLLIKSEQIQIAIFLIIGLTGLSLILIWVLTEHNELKNNFNLLWCNPLYILSSIFILFKKYKILKILSIVLLILLGSIIIVWITGVQEYQVTFLIIVAILCVCNLKSIRRMKIGAKITMS